MPVKATTPTSLPIVSAAAAALAAAALAVRKSDPAIRGRLMVKRSLLSVAAKASIPAMPPAAPAPLPKPLVPLLGDSCSQPQRAALVSPAEVFTPPSCVGSVDKLVAEPTISEQLVQGALDHAFNASCTAAPATIGASSSDLDGGLGSCHACFSRTSTSPVPPPSSFPATANATSVVGCKDAPWELVQPRRGMRRMAVASPTMKTRPPPPVWLHGRCHRCHEVGHWAASCCEQLKCNNCLQFGHKAKYCTGNTAPRPPLVQDLRRSWQRSPTRLQQHEPPNQLADVQLPLVLAEEAKLLRSELQGCLARVESFLLRAEAVFGKDPIVLDVSSSELHLGSVDNEEACLYGCFSPRAMICPSSKPVVPTAAYENEDIAGVITPVMETIPKLHEKCGDVALLKEGSTKTLAVPLPSSQAPLEPSQPLDFVDSGGLGVEDFNSPECLVQVGPVGGEVVTSGVLAPVGGEVVASSVLPPVPGALFAKKLYDFLVGLEADDPGSGKTIGCLLKEREMRTKSKKEVFGIPKERSTKSKIKKGGASRKAYVAS